MVKIRCKECRGWGKVFTKDRNGRQVYVDGKRLREICPRCWGSRFFKPKTEKTIKYGRQRR